MNTNGSVEPMPLDDRQLDTVQRLLKQFEHVEDPNESHLPHIENLNALLAGQHNPGTALVVTNAATIYINDLKKNTPELKWKSENHLGCHVVITCKKLEKEFPAIVPRSILRALDVNDPVCPGCRDQCAPMLEDRGILYGGIYLYDSERGWDPGVVKI